MGSQTLVFMGFTTVLCWLARGGGRWNTHSAVKTPILQMEKLRPSQVKRLAQEDRLFEEIRAPDPSLRLWSWSHCKPK